MALTSGIFVMTVFLMHMLNPVISSSSKHSFHFVLVHGSGHGAWCWYKVTTMLKEAGHTVDAIDLTSAGINNQDAATVLTLQRLTKPLETLLETLSLNDKVVLVGHSFGGTSLTYALEKYPTRIITGVYVAGFMLPSGPAASVIFNQITAATRNNIIFQFANGSSVPVAGSFKLDRVDYILYNESPPQDIELAKSLLKPFPVFDPAFNYTSERYGTVPRYYIKTLQKDHLFPTELQEALIDMTPPKRVLDINSDHSPFFSKPNTLVHYLLQIASHEYH